jgi:(2Fe-2S) ferredoxin
MSCDTCKYKMELDGYEEDVGGARAMLRALTHRETHADREDVDDEPHAHGAPDKHVAVCTNRTCASEGAAAVLERLRQAERDSEACEARVTRTSCLGRCGEGPMVAVSPDGVWYGGVTEEDADRLVSSHLDRGRIVSDLVDTTL